MDMVHGAKHTGNTIFWSCAINWFVGLPKRPINPPESGQPWSHPPGLESKATSPMLYSSGMGMMQLQQLLGVAEFVGSGGKTGIFRDFLSKTDPRFMSKDAEDVQHAVSCMLELHSAKDLPAPRTPDSCPKLCRHAMEEVAIKCSGFWTTCTDALYLKFTGWSWMD